MTDACHSLRGTPYFMAPEVRARARVPVLDSPLLYYDDDDESEPRARALSLLYCCYRPDPHTTHYALPAPSPLPARFDDAARARAVARS